MKRRLSEITFVGPAVSDPTLLDSLSSEYAAFLKNTNGAIAFGGGLHIRGVCDSPGWHSLQEAWSGRAPLHNLFPAVEQTDVPFGEDCVGDQFVLRDSVVHRLFAETGEMESLEVGFSQFLEHAEADPVQYLSLQPLLDFQRSGRRLVPGQLLSVYPPYCTAESQQGVSLDAMPVRERIEWLADFAGRISGVSEGERLSIRTEE